MRGENVQVKSLVQALPSLPKQIHQYNWGAGMSSNIVHTLPIQGRAFMVQDHVRQDHRNRLLRRELRGLDAIFCGQTAWFYGFDLYGHLADIHRDLEMKAATFTWLGTGTNLATQKVYDHTGNSQAKTHARISAGHTVIRLLKCFKDEF